MELEDRRDNLRLLALVARGLGAELEDYTPPSVALAEDLADTGKPDDGDKSNRALEVARFMSAAGGE